MLNQAPSGRAFVVSAILFAAACSEAPIQPDGQSSPDPAFGISTATVQDLPAVSMDLPPEPRPWDTSAVALEEALAAEDGHAVVAFKAPGSERALETGRREAVPATTVEEALELLRGEGVAIENYLAFMGAAHVRLPAGVAGTLRHHPLIDYIEPRQWWHLMGTAGSAAAFAGAVAVTSTESVPWGIEMVRAPEAWSVATGTGARIQMIDTGHDQGHEDLPLVPSNNCAGAYGGCDDGPDSWHGTHVLGTFTGRDNSVGVIGVAPGVAGSDTYVYGACESEGFYAGYCSTTEITYGIEAGIWFDVISMSLGGTQYDASMADAVARAWQEGVVLVAAAGNRKSTESAPAHFYPAEYTNVIGVSGVKTDGGFASSSPCTYSDGSTAASNYGDYVDLASPFWALSTVGNDGYEDETSGWCGTSMATPHVSGAAALLREQNPTWSNQQIVDRLLSTAREEGSSGRDNYYGYGILDAAYALGIAPAEPLSVSIDGPTSVESSGSYEWEAMPSGGSGSYTYEWHRRTNHQTSTCSYVTDWSLVGAEKIYSPDMAGFYNFDLRVKVSSAGETASHTIFVTVEGAAICPS